MPPNPLKIFHIFNYLGGEVPTWAPAVDMLFSFFMKCLRVFVVILGGFLVAVLGEGFEIVVLLL